MLGGLDGCVPWPEVIVAVVGPLVLEDDVEVGVADEAAPDTDCEETVVETEATSGDVDIEADFVGEADMVSLAEAARWLSTDEGASSGVCDGNAATAATGETTPHFVFPVALPGVSWTTTACTSPIWAVVRRAPGRP